MHTTAWNPHDEYTTRLETRARRRDELDRVHWRLAVVRVVLFVVAVALGWAAFGPGAASPFLILPAVIVFLAVAVWHERVTRAREAATRAVEYYTRGLERVEDRWTGGGERGERFRDPAHPYAEDLDLFGEGSLFQLLSTARTRTGEATLARWLLAPAPPQEIAARQAAVAELRELLDFRESLAAIGSSVRSAIDSDVLAAWGAEPRLLTSRVARIAAAILGVLGGTAALLWLFSDAGPLPLLLVGAGEGAFAAWHRARVLRVVGAAEERAPELEALAGLLRRLEAQPLTSPRLKTLQAALIAEGVPASRRIAKLARLQALAASRRNQFFAPLAALVLWTTQVAYAIDAWRAVSGRFIAEWLTAAGELEAFASLAAYAYEHPADPFAQIVPGPPLLDGRALGHPLIPAARCVRNDLRLGADLQLLVISGSNMSGKSTMLRTVGINAVLALAGSAVRAGSLTLSPLAVGGTLRVQDSLQAGRSRFYAEIVRLRQLVDLAEGPMPLLFLLDEILHGTNSHDRRHGAEAIVRGLLQRGAIGLVTTHDLALADIAEALGPRAANVHFEDRLEGGEILFDYRMRSGVVQHSNAIALMRAVGLEV